MVLLPFFFLFLQLILYCVFFFQDKYVSEEVTHKDGGPLMMNAFEMITLSQGLDLSSLFDRQQVICNSFSKHATMLMSCSHTTSAGTEEILFLGTLIHFLLNQNR